MVWKCVSRIAMPMQLITTTPINDTFAQHDSSTIIEVA